MTLCRCAMCNVVIAHSKYYRGRKHKYNYCPECTKLFPNGVPRDAFRVIRAKVIKERGSYCEECHVKLYKPVVHHIDNKGHHKTKTPNDAESNLKVLCSRCHIAILHKRSKIKWPNLVRRYREEGFTFAKIGKILGVTRQRAQQIWLSLGEEIGMS